jgi:hypothetical protein
MALSCMVLSLTPRVQKLSLPSMLTYDKTNGQGSAVVNERHRDAEELFSVRTGAPCSCRQKEPEVRSMRSCRPVAIRRDLCV